MKEKKKTSLTMRIFAWLLIVAMTCTSMDLSVFASQKSTKKETVEVQSADENETKGEDEPATVADTGTIDLKVFDVHFFDSDGYEFRPASNSANHTGNDYWAYLAPGMTCPTTIPEEEITVSTWNNCNDHIYRWENSYIKIAVPTTCTISDMRWEENVLKLTIKDGDTASQDYTLTVKTIDFAGTSAASLLESIQALGLEVSMADSYDAVKEYLASQHEGLSEKLKINMTTAKNKYTHTAKAGTAQDSSGTDGEASLLINVTFTDEIENNLIYLYKNTGSNHTLKIKVKALAYDESNKATVTVAANGNGTVKATYTGLSAQQQSDKSYQWITTYSLTATPGENHRFVTWLYNEGELKNQQYGVQNATVSTQFDRDYTAYFAENQAPTIKSNAVTTWSLQERIKQSKSFSSMFEDKTTVTVDGNTYYVTDKLTYSATIDGKELSSTEFNTSTAQVTWAANAAGTYTLVITATDNLGKSTDLTVSINVTAYGVATEYKIDVEAFYQGNSISLGEDGLDAEIFYYAGGNGDFPLENLDNEYFNKTNKYKIIIYNWKSFQEKNKFSELTIGDLTIPASDCLSTTYKMYNMNNASNAVRVQYNSTNDYAAIWVNYNKNLDLTENLKFQMYFDNIDVKLDVKAGEHGSFVETIFSGEQDGKYTYTVYGKPDVNYQLSSYTVTGGEDSVPITLTAEDYRWVESDNFFTITIEKDTEITLNFTPATMELQFWSAVRSDGETLGWNVDCFNRTINTNGQFGWNMVFASNAKSVPLVEGLGARLFFKLNISGFLAYGQEGENCRIKLYSGTEAKNENLLFDSDTDGGSVNNTPSINATLRGDRSGGIQVWIREFPCDMDNIYVEVDYAGYRRTGSYPIEVANNLLEVKEFTTYYTDTFGLDKFGREAYTAEEKQTESYQKYCQYKNFRYVLREVYKEYVVSIANAETETDRQKILVDGKQALQDASIGKNCDAVVWSFKEQDGVKDIPVMVAIPSGKAANNSMIAALEALYPGNWTYTYHATQFGAFVNKISAGSAEDTGKTVVDTEGSTGANYGFWFYNGKFSDLGISNYYTSDGDVMWWGTGNIDKNWDWAVLRFKFGDEKLASELVTRGATTTIDEISAEELETLFPEVNFSRYGQFKEVTSADLVVNQIKKIGSVSPDSKEAIEAARTAYNKLNDAEKVKVSNYDVLTKAEATYKALMEKATVSYTDAQKNALLGMSNDTIGVGSINGEWEIFSLARGGAVKATDKKVTDYLNLVEKATTDGTLSSSTDYARVVLALSSLGQTASDTLLNQCKDYDKAVAQGINAVAYALLALDSKPYDATNVTLRDKYIKYMVSQVCQDGGWVLGDDLTVNADTDVTAMVIQALAPYYNVRTDVKTAVDKGLAVLKTMQKSTGGFASYGVYNAESTAQVIVALTALGLDPTTWNGHDAVDALLHFYKDGKFSHTPGEDADQMATEQSAYALIAYARYKDGKNALYKMSDAFGTTGSDTDSTQTVTNAALAVAGLGELTVKMASLNTAEAACEYVQTNINLLGITGPTFTVTSKEFKAATAGTAENVDGIQGSFTVTVKISMTGADDASVDVKGIITPTKYVDPKADITVTFALYGDTLHDVNKDGDLHTYQFDADNMDQWIGETSITVPGDATVGDVFKKVLDAKGFTYVGLNNGYISKITNTEKNITLEEFDNTSKSGWMYLVNGEHPNVGLNTCKLEDGDKIVWHWTDDYTLESGSNMYDSKRPITYVENLIKEIGELEGTEECKKAIEQARAAYDKLNETEQAKVSNYETLTEAETTVADPSWCWHKYDDGKVTTAATCEKAGVMTYTCKHCNHTKTEAIRATGHTDGAWNVTKEATCTEAGSKVKKCKTCGTELATEAIAAAGHKYGDWKKVSDATISTPEKQQRECSICHNIETKDGDKAKATIKVTASTITLKIKQKTKNFKVTGLAKGDAVKKYESSNKKIFTVTQKGVITAGKKVGKATLTITLKSGLKKKVTVKVQKKAVAATKITGLKTKVTVKKGKKLTLKPTVKPFTCVQKVIYKTSNKKIATVTSKGVITGKKAGTAKITVTCGKKKVTVKVTVKK